MTNTKLNSNLIKYKMKEQGVSYSDLADYLECNEQNLYNMLSKKTIPTFAERLIFICYVLGLKPLDVLIVEDGDGNANSR